MFFVIKDFCKKEINETKVKNFFKKNTKIKVQLHIPCKIVIKRVPKNIDLTLVKKHLVKQYDLKISIFYSRTFESLKGVP